MPTRLLAVTTVAALALLAGCTATSHTTKCVGNSCTVDLSGEQTVELDPEGGPDRELHVGPIEDGAVTVSAQSDVARLVPGQATEVSDLRVELLTVSDDDVSLRVSRV